MGLLNRWTAPPPPPAAEEAAASPTALVETDAPPPATVEAEALFSIPYSEVASRKWFEVFDSRTPPDPQAAGNSRAPRLAVLAADMFRKVAAALNGSSDKRRLVIRMYICPDKRLAAEEADVNAPLATHRDLGNRYVAIPSQVVDADDEIVTGTTVTSNTLIEFLSVQLSNSAVDVEELLGDVLRGESMLSHGVVDFVPEQHHAQFSVAFLWKAPDVEQRTLWSVVITGLRR